MFPIQINGRYKNKIKYISRTVVIISVIIAFFTFPTYINVAAASMFALIGYLIEKIVFVYNIVHVNPFPQKIRKNQHVSIGYGYIDDEMNRPFIYLVYKTKTEAIEHFQFFESIVLGKLNDEDNNLILSIVFEDSLRYSLYIYPSPFRISALHTVNAVESTLDKNERVNLKVMSYIDFLPAIYTGEQELKEIFKKFIQQTPIEFNTCYLNNGEIIPIRKKPIKKYHLRLVERSELGDVDVESKIEWFNPIEQRDKEISS
ncbi:hypothetical protein KDC22_23635 [Paenibacillus tritici]|uniref:hypothetical protein n=1 Tax=Paenibacillus tritici TaxID=1873425 RepID=UPI001BA868AC|nr:hypothetical protein [Paenibacillus tritici]QUL53370.1 hypothetical protein KDC22_23635 [Paenibacillus tritici]